MDAFLSKLPAGEWADVKVVDAPGGMMALHSIHASATWLRSGGVPAYLKFIGGRGHSAGAQGVRLIGMPRLERVAKRLCMAKVAQIPIVRILSVDLWEGEGLSGLLIGMEQVTPLMSQIRAGETGRNDSVQVLRSLRSSEFGNWVHFDICPRNVGRRTSGEFVAIDLESLYLGDGGQGVIDVSYPAFKHDRVPRHVLRMCGKVSQGGMPLPQVQRKHDGEVVVLAAECSLGLKAYNFDDAGVEQWCAESPCSADERDFWRRTLRRVLVNGDFDLAELADELERVDEGGIMVSTDDVSVSNQSDGDLFSRGRDLRRGTLSRKEIAEYRKELGVYAEKNAGDRRVWEELLLVSLAYEKDPGRGVQLAEQALVQFPGDVGFQDNLTLARMWGGDA
ncbi:hypothetical protein [Plesiocystis pacifica]|uniref:hypothetical protein n=1 Tax=Plesiocystis pacifica TaxID=191768 RepID=UPI0012F97527|nr:hypothetical protein [Plesiocystis pacifica]